MELVWFPSIVTAFLFRGGLLVRLFSLTFVNRKGQRASGLRVFIRTLVSGLPAVLVLILRFYLPATGRISFEHVSPERYAAFAFIILVCAAIMIYRSRKRLFSDRFAGTYLVAR